MKKLNCSSSKGENLSRQVQPLYQSIAGTLRSELPQYQAGDFLPGEWVLAERFEVNRHTIRRALDVLVQEGAVLRVQGKGTQVLSRPYMYFLKTNKAFSEQFAQKGISVDSRLHKRMVREGHQDELRQLGLDEHSRVIEIQTIRWINDEAISLMKHIYSQELEKVFVAYKGGSIRYFLKQQGIFLKRDSSVIGARLPTTLEASLLGVTQITPIITVLTVSRDILGNPMELTFSINRADRVNYHVTMNGDNE